MVLFLLRGAFIVIAAAVAVLYVLQFQERVQEQVESGSGAAGMPGFVLYAAMLGGAVGLAAVVIAIDIATRRKRLSAMSGIFLYTVSRPRWLASSIT